MRVWMLWWVACLAPSPSVPEVVEMPAVASAEARPAREEVPLGPVICGLAPFVSGPHDDALEAIAAQVGLDSPQAFVSVVNTVRTSGDLPDCYLDKRQAGARGWTPGSALWDVAPGHAIGGDTFGNREGLLPPLSRPDSYAEADLDQGPGRRGAHRLVFQRDRRGDGARLWVTVDHYAHFVPVEVP